MLTIEHKEDSAAKLEAVQGKPTKNFLFAQEVNQIVEEVNSISSALNPDRIISLGTEIKDGNECTYDGYTWQLGGVIINNTGNPSVIVLPSATSGYKRNDISVFKADGTIQRVAGTETNGEVVTTPDVPEGTLYFKTYFINGDTIAVDPEPPAIEGSIYKKKIENTRFKSNLSGAEVVIPFPSSGQMHCSVINSDLETVAGFNASALTTPLYEGQDILFENQTGRNIVLLNERTVPHPFVFGSHLDVPKGGKLWLKFRNDEIELVMKSWADTDITTLPTADAPLNDADLLVINQEGEAKQLYFDDLEASFKRGTFTIDLMDLKTANFYASNDLKINSIVNVKNAPTTTLKKNDVTYTLGTLISKGDKITVETNIFSVVNLIVKYE